MPYALVAGFPAWFGISSNVRQYLDALHCQPQLQTSSALMEAPKPKYRREPCRGSHGSPRSRIQRLTLCWRTTAMTRSFPPELLDLVVGNLCDQPATLKACCLVSKSWVPRARRYLFAHVRFSSGDHPNVCDFDSWIRAFPDPLNTPAHHTRSLTISGLTAITAATTHGHAWVRSFNSIVKLAVETHWQDDDKVSLTQLHGLSSTLKSLSVNCSSLPLSEAFNLICSFPLLEDLSLIPSHSQQQRVLDPVEPPSTSPKLTGSLQLQGDIRFITRRLLDFPGGLHFIKISMDCHGACLESAVDLVSRCCDTLEYLHFFTSASFRFLRLIVPNR